LSGLEIIHKKLKDKYKGDTPHILATEALFQIGMAYKMMNKDAEAIDYLNRALADLDNPSIRYKRTNNTMKKQYELNGIILDLPDLDRNKDRQDEVFDKEFKKLALRAEIIGKPKLLLSKDRIIAELDSITVRLSRSSAGREAN
jgi:hypothetical protein